MIKNYLTIAWRNLFKNKGFSITNILGLTIGITCTIFIFLWVQDEKAYDKFHSNYNNIYQVIAHREFQQPGIYRQEYGVAAGKITPGCVSADKKCGGHYAPPVTYTYLW